jgi:hypothetical protein
VRLTRNHGKENVLLVEKQTKTKYRGPSPFDFAQGQDDDFKWNGIGCIYPEFALSRGGDPKRVGVEEEEENHAEGHEVHVDEEENSTVIEAPAPLHATNGVRRARDGGEGGENEERCGMDLREAGEEDGCEQTGQDEQNGAEERSLARIEKAGEHTVLID